MQFESRNKLFVIHSSKCVAGKREARSCRQNLANGKDGDRHARRQISSKNDVAVRQSRHSRRGDDRYSVATQPDGEEEPVRQTVVAVISANAGSGDASHERTTEVVRKEYDCAAEAYCKVRRIGHSCHAFKVSLFDNFII